MILDGACGWLSGLKPLPSAQVMISGSWDRAPHQVLCSAGSLLLPLFLPHPHPCSLSLSHSNKQIKSFFFKRFYFYLFDTEKERSQVGREAGRERGGSRLPAELRA